MWGLIIVWAIIGALSGLFARGGNDDETVQNCASAGYDQSQCQTVVSDGGGGSGSSGLDPDNPNWGQ